MLPDLPILFLEVPVLVQFKVGKQREEDTLGEKLVFVFFELGDAVLKFILYVKSLDLVFLV